MKNLNRKLLDGFSKGFHETIFPTLARQGYAPTPFYTNHFGPLGNGDCIFECCSIHELSTLRCVSLSYVGGNRDWQVDYTEYHIDREIHDLSELSRKKGVFLYQGERHKRHSILKKRNLWIIHPPVFFGLGTFSSERELELEMQKLHEKWSEVLRTDMPRIYREWSKFFGPRNPITWGEWPDEKKEVD